MVAFLESQIDLLETEWERDDAPLPSKAERAQLAEDLIAFHLTALERLEGHLCTGGLSEKDRPLVPLFQRWLSTARKVKALAKQLSSAGYPVPGYENLLRAINRSKPAAENLDHFVALNLNLAKPEAQAR